MNLDDDLRAALRREAPPPGFSGRVLARACVLPFRRRSAILALAAALAVTALIPPAIGEYRRRRAIEARDRLLTALSITQAQLEQVRERVQRNTRRKL